MWKAWIAYGLSFMLFACSGNELVTDNDWEDNFAPMPGPSPDPNRMIGPTADTFANYVDQTMQTYCRSCHDKDFINVEQVVKPSRKVLDRITLKTMPQPPGAPMPQQDIERMAAWFKAGSPP